MMLRLKKAGFALLLWRGLLGFGMDDAFLLGEVI
jgi:hypothetical protein